MRIRLLLSTLLLVTSGITYAGHSAPATEESGPKPASTKTSVALVGSTDQTRQKDTLFLASSDSQAVGVLVDYRPFNSSGFNLSAGSVTNQQTRSFQTQLPVQRAYLGVGWRKLLDDTQNFGIRVDVGAIYDDHPELEKGSSGLGNSSDAASSVTPSDWIPVVSFGVSYRF